MTNFMPFSLDENRRFCYNIICERLLFVTDGEVGFTTWEQEAYFADRLGVSVLQQRRRCALLFIDKQGGISE